MAQKNTETNSKSDGVAGAPSPCPLRAANEEPGEIGAMRPVRLTQAELSGEIGRRIALTAYANLLALDVEKDFLVPFRERNRGYNVVRGKLNEYIGLGKLIDAAVGFAAYTHNVKVRALKEYLVAEAIKTQEPDGYIGILVPEKRMWFRYDMHEMSYLILGLTNDYRYFGEEASLTAARKLADFIIDRWSAEPDRWPCGSRKDLYAVRTGLDSALLALYEQTNEPRYLDFLVNFPLFRLPEWNVEIGQSTDYMADERHAYIHLSICTAQLELCRLRPDARLLSQAEKAVRFLTQRHGMLITGSCGRNETWHDNQDCSGNVSESCATAYLIRMLDRLLCVTGGASLGDLMERGLYNALFAAQSPDGRRIRYFCAMEGERKYFGDTYCCPNNFRRIMAELPGMVCYRSDDGVTVNLYTASTATLDLDDGRRVTIQQETDYPTTGQVKLTVTPTAPLEFALRLRIPQWCPKARLTVAGEPSCEVTSDGVFHEIRRIWQPGDTVMLNMPMPWRLIRGRRLQEGRVALMRGPVVYCIGTAENAALLAAHPEARDFIVDPASLGEPAPDTSVRPDGLKVTARAWPADSQAEGGAPLSVVLTEFVDPSGIATYFRIPDLSQAVDDELTTPDVTGSQP